jgi:hypothetical protein
MSESISETGIDTSSLLRCSSKPLYLHNYLNLSENGLCVRLCENGTQDLAQLTKVYNYYKRHSYLIKLYKLQNDNELIHSTVRLMLL